MKTRKSPNYSSFGWIVLLGVFITTTQTHAEVGGRYSFASIWKLVRGHSPDLVATDHDLEAARVNESRMSRHWYPRVFAEGRAFATNDPALTFMSLLGQRQIAAPDFAPQALNQPGHGIFERGTLSLDMPLFEGGAKESIARASAKVTEAKAFERRSSEIRLYADVAKTYSSILSLQRQRIELQKLADGVGETISHYKIGAKSNPVGYSGLLGLKNLKNRLDGILEDNFAKITALRLRIRTLAGEMPESWEAESMGARDFVATHLPRNVLKTTGSEAPVSIRAMQSAAEALEKNKDAEKARFLPKVGLFATGDLYGGSRGYATSYFGGAYIQWDVFSAPNFGAVGQAEHLAAAAQSRAQSEAERMLIERSSAKLASDALEKNLSRMDESAKLLAEQTVTAQVLFRNGSINALQLVEVLARRADLLVNRADAEQGLAETRAVLFANSGVEGVPYEN